jgi:anti-sigma B factor antagonist/stage II sporulation protein AA (anti-sigma F factor antagonist)
MWSAERQGDVVIGRWDGRIDELHWEAFAEALKGAVAEADGASRLVLDLCRVEYLSSRGLRALTLGKREADGAGLPLILAAPNELVREILQISRYDKIFPVRDSVADAMAG